VIQKEKEVGGGAVCKGVGWGKSCGCKTTPLSQPCRSFSLPPCSCINWPPSTNNTLCVRVCGAGVVWWSFW
jgi:hypothetical protein